MSHKSSRHSKDTPGTGFELKSEKLIPLSEIPDGPLQKLVDYWDSNREGQPFALRARIDPMQIPDLLGYLRIVSIEPDGAFRFRLYGSLAINPDNVDMTNKTTNDYRDKAFGEMVTRHYATVARDATPRCWHIIGHVNEMVTDYLRVVLPLSGDGVKMDSLFISSLRNHNEYWEQRGRCGSF